MYLVLDKAWRSGIRFQSDFARRGAMYIATCASENLITNHLGGDIYTDKWQITDQGMDTKGELDALLIESAGNSKRRNHFVD